MGNVLYDGCSVGDLVIGAIARGGDRDAFIGGDTRWTTGNWVPWSAR